MTIRDAVFWSIVIFLVLIPGCVIGWIRGRAIARTCFAIRADLRKVGIELSPSDVQLLIGRLNVNPLAVISKEASPVARSIKQQHVETLLTHTKPLKRYFWILVFVGSAVIISFISLWPPAKP